MYDFSSLLITALFALIAGIGLGAVVSRRLSSDGRKQRDLERSLDELARQQKDYQHQVVEHFTDTAKLLNNLAESYRDVHNHLASGASELCDDDVGKILQRIPDSAMTQIAADPEPAAVQPPLDYAPKASPFATGVLNEEFGLEKNAHPTTEAPTVVEEQSIETQTAVDVPEPEAVSK